MRTVSIFTVMVSAALMFFSQPAMANRSFAEIYTDCGLGAMIAPKNDAVAAVTNVTWDLGTSAISSNITCPESGCPGGQQRMAAFIYNSYEPLENDLAKGHGRYLETLIELAGFESAEAGQEFIEALRNDFATVVAVSDYSDQSRFKKAETLYNLVYCIQI